MITIICKNCGKKFYRPKGISFDAFTKRKYCSKKCYDVIRSSIAKEKGFGKWMSGRKLSEQHINNTGCRLKGVLSKHWKGGIRKHNGYSTIRMLEHPFINKTKYFFLHRYCAECYLGRFLTSKEIIHHINGIKDDNRPENLYLFSSISEHMKYHYNPYPLKSNIVKN